MSATDVEVLCSHCHLIPVRDRRDGIPGLYCSERCERAAGRVRRGETPPPGRFPSAPLLEAVVRRYGTLKTSGWEDSLHRLMRQGDLSATQADRWAVRLGKHPYEIWDDWYDIPQPQEAA
jgi:hypothetical protein